MDVILANLDAFGVLIAMSLVLGIGIALILVKQLMSKKTSDDEATAAKLSQEIYDFIASVYGASAKLIDFAIDVILYRDVGSDGYTSEEVVGEVVDNFFDYLLNNPAKFPEAFTIMNKIGKDRIRESTLKVVLHIMQSSEDEIRRRIEAAKTPATTTTPEDVSAEKNE